MRITDFEPGDVYQQKDGQEARLFAQVGLGGDVGFFLAGSAKDVSDMQPIFRVVMNQPDFKRNFAKVGNFNLSAHLGKYEWYGEAVIGLDTKYKVRLDDLDHRTEIDEATFEALERLSVWETVHVLERLKEGRY